MPDAKYNYDLDGELTKASDASFASIARNVYTRLPERVTGRLGAVDLRYDSFRRRMHKIGEQETFYHSGVAHPAAERTKELTQGFEHYHTLVERVDDSEVVYVFTPAGQTVMKRLGRYARMERDHLRSVRTETSASGIITAHYSAYGEAIVSGGILRRSFAGYEPDDETGLYNASRRLYAPETRCFVSVDPRLQFPSPYPYCAGDPFNRIDPTGAISEATISAIVGAIILIATIVVAVVTMGAAVPAVAAEATEASSDLGMAAGAAAAEAGAAEVAAGSPKALTLIPTTTLGFVKFGAGLGFATALAQNGAGLFAKASHGEHISAWQAVRSMLVEPVIGGMAGGIGGAIGSAGIVGTTFMPQMLAFSAGGALAASTFNGVVVAAVNGQITQRSVRDSIGLSMAVSVATAMIMAPIMNGDALFLYGRIFSRRAARWNGENRLPIGVGHNQAPGLVGAPRESDINDNFATLPPVEEWETRYNGIGHVATAPNWGIVHEIPNTSE